MSNWKFSDPPPAETWCWVTDGHSVWPAKRSEDACGNWTNTDCWEDFDGEVIAWIQLEQPTAPQQARAVT